MKSLLRIGTSVLLLGLVILAVMDRRSLAELRAENDRLRTEAAALKPQEGTTAAEEELARLRKDASELPKLRGEITRLRAASNELAKARQAEERLRAENQQLRVARDSVASSTNAAGTQPGNPVPPAGYVSRDKIAFQGYGSAEASLQSTIWAMQQGQVDAVLAGMSEELQAQMRKNWQEQNKTPEQAKAELQAEAAKVQGFQLMQSIPQVDGSVLMSLQVDETREDGTLKQKQQKMIFKQIGNEWKLSSPRGN